MEKMATTAGENMDSSCYPKKIRSYKDMLEASRALRQTARKTKTEHDIAAAKKKGENQPGVDEVS